MVYLNNDLTKAEKYIFPKLLTKFLTFNDSNGKEGLENMLKRWYNKMEKERSI